MPLGEGGFRRWSHWRDSARHFRGGAGLALSGFRFGGGGFPSNVDAGGGPLEALVSSRYPLKEGELPEAERVPGLRCDWRRR